MWVSSERSPVYLLNSPERLCQTDLNGSFPSHATLGQKPNKQSQTLDHPKRPADNQSQLGALFCSIDNGRFQPGQVEIPA
jgi:hypothetical protein